MGETVGYRVTGDVALLTIGNPPVNALAHAVRAGLATGLERAGDDPEVRAIVICAKGRTFPAGADITEFGKPSQAPNLPTVCAMIDMCEKPVVAALHGTPRGGGVELALACHARVASAATTIGLPEVKLGLLPGAGGTQRVPRLIGAKAALDLILSGDPMTAKQALAAGLIDAVSDKEPVKDAVDLALRMADGEVPRKDLQDSPYLADPQSWLAAVAERRASLSGSPLKAPKRIVDCIEVGALMPLEAGMKFERAAFEDLVKSDQSAALRHVFFAERTAIKQPQLAGATPRTIRQIGIVGAGLMGAGITVACLDAGYNVTLVERDIDTLEAGVERIIDIYDRAVDKGRMKADARDQRIARLSGHTDPGAMADADLIVEAVVEDARTKEGVFRTLGRIAKPGAILATNTSYLDIRPLAAASGRPEDVIGLHFFSPAHVMPLLEIIPTDDSAKDVQATAFALARQLRKIGVRSGMTDGFIGNRVNSAYRQAAEFMLEDGASVVEIDTAMRDFGFPMGPFEVSDLAGLDIAWARRQRLAATRNPSARYVAIPDRLCELGRLGRKVGRGWYTYPRGARSGQVDPEVTAIIAEERVFQGIEPQKFSREDIQQQCLAAMVNEGAKLLDEGVARCPSDIDVVMIHGFAYPRWRGGPMQTADAEGLFKIKRDLERLAREEPLFWTPSPRFDELVKNGLGFASLNPK
ncbi:MAG: 3-hydroxyacyl-CoA dehydrogenase [Rhodobacteraceae bacterium]|nr:enoyl-CoA hydratase/isomerase family protein [Alphaproteobacteria bacterium]NNF70586.1 3-hydroxyacyl-CoA dehydrogenase [Paracoccaceae bacterium]NNK66424.1 3-hydroxyacyl-CoA dehydrogenase [Paracoccaceae bacterium]